MQYKSNAQHIWCTTFSTDYYCFCEDFKQINIFDNHFVVILLRTFHSLLCHLHLYCGFTPLKHFIFNTFYNISVLPAIFLTSALQINQFLMRILMLFLPWSFIELNYPLHTRHLLPDERIAAAFPIKSPTSHISFKYLLFHNPNFSQNSYNSAYFIAFSRENLSTSYVVCCHTNNTLIVLPEIS